MIDRDNDNDNDEANDKANDKAKTITYRIKFMDSYRFMQRSLSTLTDTLSEINNKNLEISNDTLLKSFIIHINYVIMILISLIYY